MKALLDTNILIDFLNGIEAARLEIKRYETPLISPVTWMEVMVGDDKNSNIPIEQWLSQTFTIINIDRPISIKAVEIRKKNRIKEKSF